MPLAVLRPRNPDTRFNPRSIHALVPVVYPLSAKRPVNSCVRLRTYPLRLLVPD